MILSKSKFSTISKAMFLFHSKMQLLEYWHFKKGLIIFVSLYPHTKYGFYEKLSSESVHYGAFFKTSLSKWVAVLSSIGKERVTDITTQCVNLKKFSVTRIFTWNQFGWLKYNLEPLQQFKWQVFSGPKFTTNFHFT